MCHALWPLRAWANAATILSLVVLTASKSIGPGTVARDRFDYSSSISESWKRQTLLNIVKLRYLDPPKPNDAFVAVPYRDAWFWIDDRDLCSKRAFAFMLMLFTLSDTAQRDPPPLITIPAQ